MDPVGVLLAGGQARRMGGGDKSLQPLGGRPILSHVIDRIQPQVTRLVLNVNGDPARFSGWGLPVVADSDLDHPGPMAGILAGMAWASDAADIVSVPTDTPFLPHDLVARLMDARKKENAEIAVAASGDYVHYATALWPVALAAELHRKLAVDGLRKMEDFLRPHRVAVVTYDTENGDPFFNINSPEDLAEARTRISS